VISAQRADEPLPNGRLSIQHYRAIHRHLFRDVYRWAGRYRVSRISKGNNTFCYPEHIPREMRKLFRGLATQQFLRHLSRGLAAARTRGRRNVLIAILAIFLIHVVEIGLYALVYWFADRIFGIGGFAGARELGSFDYFYFSAETFTTLGLGDIYPIGPLRLIASIEPINGLLLLGWSTSFTFYEMQRYWSVSPTDKR